MVFTTDSMSAMLDEISSSISAGNLIIDIDIQAAINEYVLDLLNRTNTWSSIDISNVDKILRISNILYNNSTLVVLLLDDGVYDQLIVAYKRYNPNYQVGSDESSGFKDIPNNETLDRVDLYSYIPQSVYDNNMYVQDIANQSIPMNECIRPIPLYTLIEPPITKRLINTQHKYPELVGTLDKCKFTLNQEAINAGVFDNPSVSVFERDFIAPLITSGVINPNGVYDMVGELKYDGVSIEAEVCRNRIISAYSRGDTSNNVATDLTPIFKDYVFYNNAMNNLDNLSSKYDVLKDPNYKFGIKFEAVITKLNLDRLSKARNRAYKNGRNAIIGLLGASDAYRYAHYITLIPISTSVGGPRIAELKFLNTFYNSGEYNRFVSFRGTYIELLYQINQFAKSAEAIRPILPYMIDGIVVSFTDENIKTILGRVNSVNKWQIAIKFNPRNARTTFLGYTYSIGKSGNVVPIVHFKPVEFIGTIHNKQTIHSYQRFRDLKLIKGQEIDIEYVNDVLSYITKPDTELNRLLDSKGQPEEFIQNCPYCGTPIVISNTAKSAICPNVYCHERQIMRMIYALDKLGFKDISEDVVRSLDITDFSKLFGLLNADISLIVNHIGPITTNKLLDYIRYYIINKNPIQDYILMAALSFGNMATEKWKLILRTYSIRQLYGMDEFQLRSIEELINGIGETNIQSIIDGFKIYKDDMNIILDNMNIIDSNNKPIGPKVVLTGTRDPALIDIIHNLGYDCEDNYSVTKDTKMLITADINSHSSKTEKAIKYNIPILSIDEFLKQHNIQLN